MLLIRNLQFSDSHFFDSRWVKQGLLPYMQVSTTLPANMKFCFLDNNAFQTKVSKFWKTIYPPKIYIQCTGLFFTCVIFAPLNLQTVSPLLEFAQTKLRLKRDNLSHCHLRSRKFACRQPGQKYNWCKYFPVNSILIVPVPSLI